MKKYIIITADTNDGDYVKEKTEISEEEIKLITPVINAIKEFNEDKSITYQKYNWYDLEYAHRSGEQYLRPYQRYVENGKCSEEAFEIFSEMIPYSEHGVHTIESIEIIAVVEEIKLL